MLHGFAHSLCGLKVATLLDAVQAADEFCGLDSLHRQVTNPREDVQFQMPDHLFRVTGGPLAVFLRLAMPSARTKYVME